MRKKGNSYAKWILFVSMFGLLGCHSPSGYVLHMDYGEYSKEYGQASNEELLLNLARLANNEPIYFVQLASISSQYQFNSTMGFSPSYVRNTPGFYRSASAVTQGAFPPTGSDTVSSGSQLLPR